MSWLKTISKLELLFLGAVILAGSFFRLFNIKETAMFLGDQGRDAIIAKDILKNGDIALIGPVTSVGNMYLGPFYYYFMVPSLALTYPDPIGPALAVALVGIATIPLMYFIAKKMYGIEAGVVATILFTCSQIAIDQVRFSWNPNIAPTVGLLIFYLCFTLITQKKYKDIVWLSILFAILSQLHYMALLVGVFIVLCVLYTFLVNKEDRGKIIKNSIFGVVLFALSITPLVIFDLRHDHTISKGFSTFFTSQEQHLLPAGKMPKVMSNFSGNLYKLLPQMVGSVLQSTHQLGTALMVVLVIFAHKKFKNQNQKIALWLGVCWLVVSAIFMGLYSSSIFVHYYSFSQGVSLLFIGAMLGALYKHARGVGKVTTTIALVTFVLTSPAKSTAFIPGQSHIENAQKTSNAILKKLSQGEKYNIVLISGTGDIEGHSYRYFLETSDHPPVKKENRGEADTLFIIQEDYFDKKVTDSPIYEIVVFPDKNPVEVYTIENGQTITILKRK